MFGQRLVSGIILLGAMIGIVVFNEYILLTALGIISLIGLFELYRTSKIEKTPLAILGYLVTILFYVILFLEKNEYAMELIILFLMVLMICYVFTFPAYEIEQVTISFFGLFYVSMMLSYIYQVRMLDNGLIMVGLIFIGAWGSDTCAYCVGVLFGKHKLPSKLSPKKSIEGSIGGVVGAAIIGVIYGIVLKDEISLVSNPVLAFGIIGASSSVIAQIGDLAASAIKRNHNIKDYGTLIPGHGGILDRFDSIIFTAPIVYFLAKIL
jgi:phosphatidate cytidylyltransferase